MSNDAALGAGKSPCRGDCAGNSAKHLIAPHAGRCRYRPPVSAYVEREGRGTIPRESTAFWDSAATSPYRSPQPNLLEGHIWIRTGTMRAATKLMDVGEVPQFPAAALP